MQRPCSECDELLPEGSKAKTCSASCRQKRARRTKKARAAGAQNSATRRGMSKERKEALEDVAHEVMKEELTPIIREAITKEAVESLKALVGLLPGVVEELEADIHDTDDLVRQKAHGFVLKYAFGPGSLPDESGSALTIINAMPRPDSSAPESSDGDITDATEMRVCDICEDEKPAPQFVGASSRCEDCMAKLQSKVADFQERTSG